MEPDEVTGQRGQDESGRNSCQDAQKDAARLRQGEPEGNLTDQWSQSRSEEGGKDEFSKGFLLNLGIKKNPRHDGPYVIEILSEEGKAPDGEYSRNEGTADGSVASHGDEDGKEHEDTAVHKGGTDTSHCHVVCQENT